MKTSCRVLIVEDELMLSRLVRKLLQRSGMEITTATDGAEAVTLLESGIHFDVIITDLLMPNVDGFSLLEYCYQHVPQVPVIVMTAHEYGLTHKRVKELGAFAFFAKPFDIDTLRQRVMEACTQARRATTEAP